MRRQPFLPPPRHDPPSHGGALSFCCTLRGDSDADKVRDFCDRRRSGGRHIVRAGPPICLSATQSCRGRSAGSRRLPAARRRSNRGSRLWAGCPRRGLRLAARLWSAANLWLTARLWPTTRLWLSASLQLSTRLWPIANLWLSANLWPIANLWLSAGLWSATSLWLAASLRRACRRRNARCLHRAPPSDGVAHGP